MPSSGPDPENFALDPEGKVLYVANEDSNRVTVVDIDRGEVVTEIPVGVEPEGMGLSPDGKYLVNTSETTNMAHLIDTAKRRVVANILVDSRPRRALWTDDGVQFWVSAEIGGTVSVVDAGTYEIVKRIAFAVPGVPAEGFRVEPCQRRPGGDDRDRPPRGLYRCRDIDGARGQRRTGDHQRQVLRHRRRGQ